MQILSASGAGSTLVGAGLGPFQPKQAVGTFVEEEVQGAEPGREAAQAVPENLVIGAGESRFLQDRVFFGELHPLLNDADCIVFRPYKMTSAVLVCFPEDIEQRRLFVLRIIAAGGQAVAPVFQ